MVKLAIIGGTVFFKQDFLDLGKARKVTTDYGDVSLFQQKNLTFIPRHGIRKDVPPHKVNHMAHMAALKKLGVSDVIGVSSVGTLKTEFKIGSMIICSDYIDFHTNFSFFDNKIRHITPGMDEKIRQLLVAIATGEGLEVMSAGVYVQTKGPRLETKAEINMLKNFGDVVGMSMGTEATLAKELDLSYANISSIDNYAHGLTDVTLKQKDITLMASNNAENIKSIILKVIKELK